MGIYVNMKLAGRNPMKPFVPPRPRVVQPVQAQEPPSKFITKVCDTNLSVEFHYRGMIRFAGLGIELRVYADNGVWPYESSNEAYVFTTMKVANPRTKKKVEHRFFRHQIAYKGIKYITRTSARDFTVECYARKPYHISFKEPENASIFAETMSEVRALHNVSALDLLDFVGEPNFRRYDRLLDEVANKPGLDFWTVKQEGVMRSTGGTYRPFGLVMVKQFESERVLTEITLKIQSYMHHMIAVIRSHMQDYTTLDVDELLANYILFKQSPEFQSIKLTPAQLEGCRFLGKLNEESLHVRAAKSGRFKRRFTQVNHRLRSSGGRLRKWTAKTALNIANSLKPVKTLQTRAVAWMAGKPSIKSVIAKGFRKIFRK